MSQPTRPCVLCAFPIPEESGAASGETFDDSPRCPVCRDGQEDPWAMIRGIRAQFGKVARVMQNASGREEFATVEILETDRRMLLACLDTLWPGLAFGDVEASSFGPDDIATALEQAYGYEPKAAQDLTKNFLRLHERLHGHWGIVAESLVRRSQLLRPRDLDGIEATLTGLAQLIAERYEISEREARVNVLVLLEDLHFPKLLRLAPNTRAGEPPPVLPNEDQSHVG